MNSDDSARHTKISERWSTLGTLGIIVCALVLTVTFARIIDSRRSTLDLQLEDEGLYLGGPTLKRASLSFNGLAADWYWMRSLQYVGNKLLNAKSTVRLDDLSSLDLKLLVSLLDTTTTLDPEFMEPYQYAAVILPAINVEEAIRITRKGIAANPSAWQLYQHLGYIYWQKKEFYAASEAYGQGSRIAGAPRWMEAMKAKMASEGGSRNVAREIYGRMYEEATEDEVKEMAKQHLLQLDSLDQRDTLQKLLSSYQTKVGRCPSSWREAEPALRNSGWRLDSSGTPLDPTGMPYVLKNSGCDVELHPKSEIPQL
ncbi:MAG: tetratricopeptide repeat protein [Pyrinomonadaceae bacterium]